MKEALGTIAYVAPEARLHVDTELMEKRWHHRHHIPNVGDVMGFTGRYWDMMGYRRNRMAIVGITRITIGI